MPVTGNNTYSKTKILSIRVATDGLCFWTQEYVQEETQEGKKIRSAVPETSNDLKCIEFDGKPLEDSLRAAAERIKDTNFEQGKPLFDSIYVYLDTFKTILVPEDVYRPGTESEYMKLHNYTIAANEQLDVSRPICGTVAIMVSRKDILKILGETLGEFAVVSPLQYNILNYNGMVETGKCRINNNVIVYLSRKCIYISVFKKGQAESGLIYNSIVPYISHEDVLFHLNWVYNNYSEKGLGVYVGGVLSSELRTYLRLYFKAPLCV